MVCAPQVDDAVEAALKFIAVISNISSKIGGHAIVADNNAVLVIAIGGRVEPQSAVLFINAALLLQIFAGLLDFAAIMQRLLTEPYVKGYAEGLEVFLQACQLFFISNL